ncbi:NAD-dependent deacetylase [Nocardioides sp. TRM66260-LWL]|uniref:Sir2 family NAD-dependent protein deacetylase n=1 Tax=Nocardioides sp. TRM66260-LWL TaxID=2874478 RepID=UPI001CC6EECF|nr:Sir2 family NAD-dependent protein deacetylase [Nocardioides sp. TRM66260-LWL]MBZ5735161.1 NAD-dependent deacetylase [Nocardioides sp. TRM66260-LWL]
MTLSPVVRPLAGVRSVTGASLPREPEAADPARAEEALALLAPRRLVVLTGAGLSTDSGIPDYRGPGAPERTPMTFQEFCSGPEARQRYWARSHVGWGRMRRADPNAGHRAVASLDAGLVITQNVDGLHERAGTPRLVALHGRIADVVCLSCRTVTPRSTLQERLAELNPGWLAEHADAQVRPDGDVLLDDTAGFAVPDCPCGGVLKPDVVFFGESVPRERVARCFAAVDALTPADGALLVAGSSLAVMSGLRFVRRAAKAGVPVVLANRGRTRGDEHATCAVETDCTTFLTRLAALRS